MTVGTIQTVAGMTAQDIGFLCWYLRMPHPVTIMQAIDLSAKARELNIVVPDDADKYAEPADLRPITDEAFIRWALPRLERPTTIRR